MADRAVAGAWTDAAVVVGGLALPLPTAWARRVDGDRVLAVEVAADGAISVQADVLSAEELEAMEASPDDVDTIVAAHLRGYLRSGFGGTVVDVAELVVDEVGGARLLYLYRLGIQTMAVEVLLLVGAAVGSVRVQVAGPATRREEVSAVTDVVVARSRWASRADVDAPRRP